MLDNKPAKTMILAFSSGGLRYPAEKSCSFNPFIFDMAIFFTTFKKQIVISGAILWALAALTQVSVSSHEVACEIPKGLVKHHTLLSPVEAPQVLGALELPNATRGEPSITNQSLLP